MGLLLLLDLCCLLLGNHLYSAFCILHSAFCILYSVSVQRQLIYHAHAHRLYYASVRSMIYLVYGGRTIAMLPWLGSRAIPRPSEIAGIGTFPNLGHYAAGTVTHVILIGIHPLE